MQEKFIKIKKGKIYYKIKKGKKKVLVFLHGGGGSISSWEFLMPYFKKSNCTLIYIDLRGHGRSLRSNNWQDYVLEKHALDVNKIIKKEEKEKVSIIGHCLGSMVAATFTALYPNMVEKLILINPGHELPGFLENGKSSLREILETSVKIVNGRHLLKLNLADKPYQRRVDYKKFQKTHDISLRRIWADFRIMGIESVLFQAIAFLEWDGKKYFSKINLPTLIIGGKKDIIFPEKTIRETAALIKNAKVEIINSNHISVINNPKQVYEKIKTFLFYNNSHA